MAERKIKNVFCIVHPFYVPYRPDLDRKIDLGYWKSVVDMVRSDPSAILVGAVPFSDELGRELREYAKERLGDRFNLLVGGPELRGSSFEKKELGPLSKSAKLFVCGEYYDGCVPRKASELASKLGIPKKHVFLMPDLSLHSVGEKPPGSIIGEGRRRFAAESIERQHRIRAPVTAADFRRLDRLRGFSVIHRHKVLRRPR
jgi:hypothetical protein